MTKTTTLSDFLEKNPGIHSVSMERLIPFYAVPEKKGSFNLEISGFFYEPKTTFHGSRTEAMSFERVLPCWKVLDTLEPAEHPQTKQKQEVKGNVLYVKYTDWKNLYFGTPEGVEFESVYREYTPEGKKTQYERIREMRKEAGTLPA